jgi:lipoyl(octanoyl) transferase
MPINLNTSQSDYNNSWRLVKSLPSSASYNMALDETFLFTTARKKTPPTLRLYSWESPSISLGYAQSINDVDQEELSKRKWQLVRRPTGGRAILHTDELTYSITASLDNPLVEGSLLESYQRIAGLLQKALKSLGAVTHAENAPELHSNSSKADPVCFQTPSNFEITWNGKKLIGSAQARKMGGVLQHGSLPLSGDLSRITQVLTYPSEQDRETSAQKTLAQATTLKEVTGMHISWEDAAIAIITSFKDEFGISFIMGQPTKEEISYAVNLMQSKYSSDSWNKRI